MVALFMVVTITLFLAVDVVYQKMLKRKLAMEQSTEKYRTRPLILDEVDLPGGIFFHPGHTWASLLSSGLVKIGLNDLIQRLVGKIDRIEVIKNDGEVKQGEPLLVIHQGNKSLSFAAPVDGEVTDYNTELLNNPSGIKSDPYQNGWVCAIKPNNLSNNLNILKIAESAKSWFKDEVNKLKEFFAAIPTEGKVVGQTLQDGGIPIEGVLEYLDEKSWKNFEEDFLHNS